MERKQKTYQKQCDSTIFNIHFPLPTHKLTQNANIFFGGVPIPEVIKVSNLVLQHGESTLPRSIASKTFIATFDRLKNPGDFVGFNATEGGKVDFATLKPETNSERPLKIPGMFGRFLEIPNLASPSFLGCQLLVSGSGYPPLPKP